MLNIAVFCLAVAVAGIAANQLIFTHNAIEELRQQQQLLQKRIELLQKRLSG